jgi:hypothetical protein
VKDAEGGPQAALDAITQTHGLPRQSNQSKVRVTAFFQYL